MSVRRNAIVGVATRSATIGATLVAFPLLLHHLGPAVFGVWATITSLQAVLSFADLGLGTATTNLVTDAEAKDDRPGIRRVVADSYALLSGVAVGLAVVLLAAAAAFDLGALVGQPGASAERAVVLFVLGFAALIPLSVITRLQTGLHRSGEAYVWVGAGALLGLVGNALCVALGGELEAAVATTIAGPVIALMANTLVFFRAAPELAPRLADVSRAGALLLVPAGLAFFVQQTATAIGHQSDALIVTQVLGPASATDYVLPAKLFYLAPVLLTFALLPVWPAIRQAVARGDVAQARQTIVKLTRFTLSFALAGAVALLLLGGPVVELWSSGEVELSRDVAAAFAAWMVSGCLVIACGFVLAGVGGNRLIAGTYLAMAVLNVPLSIALTHELGISGVIIGTTVANTACIVVPTLLLVPRLLRALDASGPRAPR